jgi:hypothetical protein
VPSGKKEKKMVRGMSPLNPAVFPVVSSARITIGMTPEYKYHLSMKGGTIKSAGAS